VEKLQMTGKPNSIFCAKFEYVVAVFYQARFLTDM